MRCSIPGANVPVFGRAIHCLGKIGDEIYIEALPDGLAMRTVNSSRSAFASFLFVVAFFDKYQPNLPVCGDSGQTWKFKLTAKSCLGVFKSVSNLERTVNQCIIELDETGPWLQFQLFCVHGIVKTHCLSYQQCESLQALFNKQLTSNLIVAQSRLLSESVVYFPVTLEEISLISSPTKLVITNYTEDDADKDKAVKTEVALLPAEFDQFQIGVDTEITFSVKELRALLGFSDVLQLPLMLRFERGGMPVVYSLMMDQRFEADFVFATLADASQPTQADASQPTLADASQPGGTVIEMNSTMVSPQRELSTDKCQDEKGADVDLDDSIPATPPHKKSKLWILGEVMSSERKQNEPSRSTVLVPDSDSE